MCVRLLPLTCLATALLRRCRKCTFRRCVATPRGVAPSVPPRTPPLSGYVASLLLSLSRPPPPTCVFFLFALPLTRRLHACATSVFCSWLCWCSFAFAPPPRCCDCDAVARSRAAHAAEQTTTSLPAYTSCVSDLPVAPTQHTTRCPARHHRVAQSAKQSINVLLLHPPSLHRVSRPDSEYVRVSARACLRERECVCWGLLRV